jgi:hypothetical protein
MDQVGMNEQDIQFNDAPSNPHGRLAKSAFVCGIIAVSLNLLAVTAVIGFFVGIFSIVFGAKTYRQSVYGKSGLVLGFLSMFVIVAYVLSAVAIKVADPFL